MIVSVLITVQAPNGDLLCRTGREDFCINPRPGDLEAAMDWTGQVAARLAEDAVSGTRDRLREWLQAQEQLPG